jgi:hypothetical protein
LFFLLVVIGILYSRAIAVKIEVPSQNLHPASLSFTVSSDIRQDISIDLSTDPYPVTKVVCDGQTLFESDGTMKWYATYTERVSFGVVPDHKVQCTVFSLNHNHSVHLDIARIYSMKDIAILLLVWGIPFAYLLYRITIFLLYRIKRVVTLPAPVRDKVVLTQRELYILYGVVVLGMAIRVFYFERFGMMHFQHDWQGHIAYIKYMASCWSLPLPTKGLEYPQQPLYYWITAAIYQVAHYLGYTQMQALEAVGAFSVWCSMVFVYYTYKTLAYLQYRFLTRLIAMVFVSFTPSLVYMSARINNDALIVALSAMALYAVVRLYYTVGSRDFYAALFWVSALFLTKISTLSFELLLLAVLLILFLRSVNEAKVQNFLALYITTGVILLVLTLVRVYMPLDEAQFHMVNSSAYFPGQQISELDLGYFMSFHFGTLLQEAQSYVFGADSIRFSFPTYQYGTMIFGEFDYREKGASAAVLGRMLIVLSLLYPLGVLASGIMWLKNDLLNRLFLLSMLINLILIVSFLSQYPVVCNTDFRYFVANFAVFALIAAKGIEYLYRYAGSYMEKVVYIWVVWLAVIDMVFLINVTL